MKKFYRIVLLIITLIFLTTFNPKELSLIYEESDPLFRIKNVEMDTTRG